VLRSGGRQRPAGSIRRLAKPQRGSDGGRDIHDLGLDPSQESWRLDLQSRDHELLTVDGGNAILMPPGVAGDGWPGKLVTRLLVIDKDQLLNDAMPGLVQHSLQRNSAVLAGELLEAIQNIRRKHHSQEPPGEPSRSSRSAVRPRPTVHDLADRLNLCHAAHPVRPAALWKPQSPSRHAATSRQ